MENPIEKFNSWWKEALSNSSLDQKSAVCISTIDEKGFPAGRFVDLKQVDERGFIYCTAFESAIRQFLIGFKNWLFSAGKRNDSKCKSIQLD